jgi:hypothetical protein
MATLADISNVPKVKLEYEKMFSLCFLVALATQTAHRKLDFNLGFVPKVSKVSP